MNTMQHVDVRCPREHVHKPSMYMRTSLLVLGAGMKWNILACDATVWKGMVLAYSCLHVPNTRMTSTMYAYDASVEEGNC